MKTIIVILFAFISINVFAATTPPKNKKIEITNTSSIYVEYKEENGVLWRYVYDDDGSLIFKEKVFE
jgi:hypothetical protein